MSISCSLRSVDARPGGRTPVAVVSRSVLQGWITQLSSRRHRARRDLSRTSRSSRRIPDTRCSWLEKSAPHRAPPRGAAVCGRAHTGHRGAGGGGRDPGSARRRASVKPNVSGERHSVCDPRRTGRGCRMSFRGLPDKFASLKVQLLTEGPLPWLARASEAHRCRQSAAGRVRSLHRLRRPLAPLAHRGTARGGASRSPTSRPALQIHQANHETAALDTQIAQIFSQVMPAEKMQDPRRQMQSRLDRIRHSGAGPEYFLRTLQALSSALPPRRTPTSIRSAIASRRST